MGVEYIKLNAHLNYDNHLWEIDLMDSNPQANNKAYASMVILPPNNPNSFVNKTGCPTNTTDSNSWDYTLRVRGFNGGYKEYSKFDNSKTYGFYNYKRKYDDYTETDNYNESYKIDSVLFKSKFTTENKYGTDGWVDLTKSSEKDKAKIKAGYGYELEINVTYKTDIFSKQPKATLTRNPSVGSFGRVITNWQTSANVHNDIYVRTHDGKTLSATGMYGTIQAFDATVIKNTNSEVKIKYTMKTKNVNGVNQPLKIFTDENSTNGIYSLNVFTPTITGVGTKANSSDLCDYRKLQYKVQGSMYDDNSDHIVQ